MGSFEPVSLCKCETYEYSEVRKALVESLSLIDGLKFVTPGMKVGIKANLVTGMAPEKAVTTHPILIRVLCDMLTEKGATVVIGDSPGGLFTSAFLRGVYKSCGLLELENDKVKLNDDFSVRDAEFPEAVSIKNFSYTGWLDKCDAIVNISKLKTHAMMGMSCAVKNMFGTIPGTTKPEYHMRFPVEKAFANVMVDLNEFFKPMLYIVDGIDGMEGNGPTAGEKRHVGVLLSSKKPYALDMACADIIGMTMNDVATIGAAYERGLGPKDISEVDVLGDIALSDVMIADFKRATEHQSITFEGKGAFNTVKSFVFKIAFSSKPQVKKDECIGCRKCFETCPASAITMITAENKTGKNGKIPHIDRNKCIKCFCCQEFCPVGAMKVRNNALGRLVKKIG
ncbi:MAG: DUF362 domain-containing protein [Butyrivibrio sp.]|nr:DUF362 domain-containing protein [Butyrivibrio sp.]